MRANSALPIVLGCLWLAACAGPPDMTRGRASGPYERLLLPPAGTRAVDGPAVADRPGALNRLENPLPASTAVLAEGAELYRIYCAVCHGADGSGESMLAEHLPRLPDLRSPLVRRRADGRLYGVILRGGFRMPAYADALGADERWAVVHHVRTLSADAGGLPDGGGER